MRTAASRAENTPTLLLVLLLAAALLPRLPVLWNAAFTLSADEAVNALVVKHLLEGRELSLFTWDATYFGLAEGVLAIPFVLALGFTPLAFKLSAVAGHLALVAAVFLLGRRLYGTGAGLAAAALLTVFSPQLVLWSTLASGGYCLVVAWGTLTIVLLDRQLAAPSRRRLFALGLMLGFGLYVYQLYLVYLAALAIWAAGLALAGRAGAALGSEPRARRQGAALLAAGFLLGWAPQLLALLFGPEAGRVPRYDAVGLTQATGNLRRLLFDCVPVLFGVNPAGRPDLERWVGWTLPGALPLGLLLLAAYLAAWLRGAARAWRRPWSVEALLVLLPPVAAALFVASANVESVLSSRYLLPCLTSLSVLAGGALAWLGRRRRAVAAALAFLLIGYPAVQVAAWAHNREYVDDRLRPVRRHEPIYDVLAYLERRGIGGAYGWYWLAYKATMLSGERIVVAPLEDWDRYPVYTRAVDRLDRVAYVFRTDWKALDPTAAALSRWRLDGFLNRLEGTGRPYVMAKVGPYEIYHGPRGERLLPPALPGLPVPLSEPRAEVELAGPAPAAVRPGERFRVPVRLTNRSDAHWSTSGLPLQAGTLRVSASYRWLAAGGEPLPIEGERSLLPGDVPRGGVLRLPVRVVAPPAAGRYLLRITLVQEGVAWFDQATGSGSAPLPVEVRR